MKTLILVIVLISPLSCIAPAVCYNHLLSLLIIISLHMYFYTVPKTQWVPHPETSGCYSNCSIFPMNYLLKIAVSWWKRRVDETVSNMLKNYPQA